VISDFRVLADHSFTTWHVALDRRIGNAPGPGASTVFGAFHDFRAAR
jgi:hypothetical protein